MQLLKQEIKVDMRWFLRLFNPIRLRQRVTNIFRLEDMSHYTRTSMIDLTTNKEEIIWLKGIKKLDGKLFDKCERKYQRYMSKVIRDSVKNDSLTPP